MTQSITAVFEAGVLRPTAPLDLAEGACVKLIMLSDDQSSKATSVGVANILREIAALPTQGGDPRTSENHDRILYGDPGAR